MAVGLLGSSAGAARPVELHPASRASSYDAQRTQSGRRTTDVQYDHTIPSELRREMAQLRTVIEALVDVMQSLTATRNKRQCDGVVREGMERRQHDRRTRAGRRRPDAITAKAELPRVLLIEPHEDTRLLYAYLLEESGYGVDSVADGIAGIRAAQRRLPDVVIMEVAVPSADGFEVLRQLRDDASTANIPAIVVTSMLHFDVPARARASGAVTVLAKPTELEQLLAVVDEVLMTTPRDRLVGRQLRRPLLALRELAKRFTPNDSAQQRLRALIDRLQVAVLAIDEQGRYVAASPEASALIGHSHAELLTKSIFDAALSVDLPIALRWQSVLRDQQTSADATIHDWGTSRVTIQTAFEQVLPGLHVAAFSRIR